MSSRFEWYQLRTTDVPAAASFYAGVLGLEAHAAAGGFTLSAAGVAVASIAALPEQARARGAPAHWLGQIGVDDVGGTLARARALGAERLGPPDAEPNPPLAIVRDPSGAIVGLVAGRKTGAREPGIVRSHDHLSRDREAAWRLYHELFGWQKTADFVLDGMPAEVGPYQRFASEAACPPTGAFLSAARLPHIHPQWLYYFAVPNITLGAARVREAGGLVVSDPFETPFGARITQCDDAQGAAFGLWQE